MATATFVPLATQTLSSAASSIIFSSIAGTYSDLHLIIMCTSNVSDIVSVQYNSDTGTNYTQMYFGTNGTSPLYGQTNFASYAQLSSIGAVSTTVPSLYELDIMGYSQTTTQKLTLVKTSCDYGNFGAVETVSCLWKNTAAINSVKLFLRSGNNFSSGTTATLWGI